MDEGDLPGLEETPPARSPLYRRERHLASAITLTEIDYVLEHRENPKALRPHHKRLLEDIEGLTILPATSFLSWCLRNLDSLQQCPKDHLERRRRAEDVAHMAASAAYTHYYKTPAPDLTKKKLPLDTPYARLSLTWTSVISTVAQSFVSRQEVVVGEYKFVFDSDICFVRVSSRTCFLVPYSLILCFSDMSSSWFSVDCYAAIHDKKYPGHSLLGETRRCLETMMQLVREHQQRAYSMFKMWPSLVIGSILRDIEFSPDFLETITEDVDPLLKRTPFFTQETRPVTSPTNAMLRLEVTGLWKTMGHPVINVDASAACWMSKGMVMKRGLEPAARSINNMFKKEFCRQYYKTHKKWPNISLSPGSHPHIAACYNSNEWGETSTQRWSPDDFEGVTLLKNFEFNYHIDSIDIISDKAIIPRLSEWIYEYDSKAFRTLHGRFPVGPEPTTKSVVMHYLTTEVFDCKEILSLIDQGIIPSEWRVMVAVLKEREFKEIDARCYGKMTPEMRAYQVVTEKNLADIIFRYIKHQSMTLTEEQLTKTLNRMSCPGEGHDYVNIR